MTSDAPPLFGPFAAPPAAVEDAVQAGLGALLADKDVAEVLTLEGGFLEVVRRGRRERLDAVLEGPLLALVREHGAERGVVRYALKGGHALTAGPLVDGRVALRITKAPALDATLEGLVQEGLLPAGVPEELVAAVLEGAGLLVLGSARAGRQRVLAGVVRALQGRLAWFACTDALAGLVPVALDRASSTLDKAKAAVFLGADAVCALELSIDDVSLLARAHLGVPLVASVACPSMEALAAALEDDGVDIAGAAVQAAVVGHAPDGRPRLIELHGPTRTSPQESSGAPPAHDDEPKTLPPPSRAGGERSGSLGDTPSPPGTFERPRARTGEPREVSGLVRRPAGLRADGLRADGVVEEEPLPPLGDLPAGWGSEAPDHDPGWELGGPPPPGGDEPGPGGAGTFDAALAAKKGRPSFAPRPPRPHPQTASLRGDDPFGGLTLEPPPGGPPDDDEGGP